MYTNNLDFVAKVKGVLNKNVDIRNEHLLRNYGKYSQYTSELTPAIGEISTIDYNRPLYSITNGLSLLDYTHNGDGVFSNMINSMYFNKEREKDFVGFDTPTQGQIEAWAGKFIDYTQYIDEILGEDVYSKQVKFINDFLSGEYIENALRQTEVGIIRDINVSVAKQGIITTNTNNLSGKDTKLGTVTNYMYSTMLYNGAIFNSDRKSEDKYITPSLINQYGNNLANVMELGDIMRVGTGDYEIKDNLGADAFIVHKFNSSITDLNTNWTNRNIDQAQAYLSDYNKGFNGYKLGESGYVEITEADGNIFSVNDISEFTDPSKFNEPEKIYGNKKIYNENDNANDGYTKVTSNEDSVAFEHYEVIDGSINNKSILSKTAKLFNEHKINTLIGRFHTSVDGGISTNYEFIDTAKTKFGNSHGRNLLTKKAQDSEGADADDINNYDNPYCRTWTFHHQYDQVKKLIRPFMGDYDNKPDTEDSVLTIEDLQNKVGKYRNRIIKTDKNGKETIENIGAKYLADNTVLGNNGFVNITPKGTAGSADSIGIEKCMFSIENLAWKDIDKSVKTYIGKEQTGPNGGRIMWFPPYDLSFNENVNVNWNSSQFIGRGEKVYTYTDTDRTGNLSFTLLIDHPSIINSFKDLNELLKDHPSKDLNNNDISKDIDGDILRYFAGCGIPDINDSTTPHESGSTIPPEEFDPITGSIKFYVYFPNNFSGTHSHDREVKNDVYIYEDGDKLLWAKKLLLGKNCDVPDDSSEWIGYEVTKDVPITVKSDDPLIYNNYIAVSKLCAQNTGSSNGKCANADKYIGKDDEEEHGYYKDDWTGKGQDGIGVDKKEGTHCYKYPVDPDLRQLQGSQESYNDENSKQLNTVLNSEYHSDATCSFGEFICALIKSGKIDFNNNETSSENDITNDNIYEYLVSVGGCDEGRINQLISIFSDNSTEFLGASAVGCADTHDSCNADMLAKRRANSIKNLILYNTKLGIDESIFEKPNSEKSQRNAKNGVSQIDNKLDRNAIVTLSYEIASKQKLSDSSSEATNEDKLSEEGEKQAQFDEFYEKLVENATSIISKYESFKDNDDYEKQYNVFKRDLKSFCEENEISYNIEDYNDDASKYNEVIDKFIEKYGYEYILNADVTSNENTDSNSIFTRVLALHPLTELKEESDEKITNLKNKRTELTEENDGIKEEIDKLTKKIEKLGGSSCPLCEDFDECCYGTYTDGEETKDSKNKELVDKITPIEKENSDYDYEKTAKEAEIDKLNYQLDHWTTKYGEKAKIKLKISNLKIEIDGLNRKISVNNGKIEKYQNDIDENNAEIEQYQGELMPKQELYDDNVKKIEEYTEEINKEVEKQTSTGAYLLQDLIQTCTYYDEMYKLDLYTLENYKHSKTTDEFPFETSITILDTTFPYTKYGDTIVHDFGGNKLFLSYNKLLFEYLVINKMKNIDNGFEFACQYLFDNYEGCNIASGFNGHELIRQLCYIEYLLNGEKSDNIWADDNSKVPTEITYKRAWNFIVNNFLKNKLAIDYKPFEDAVLDVNSAIKEYESIEEEKRTKADLNKLMKILKQHTNEVLEYCSTICDDFLKEAESYADDKYNQAKTALEKEEAEKNAQKLAQKQKEEEEANKRKSDELKKQKESYLYKVFQGEKEVRYENEGEYFERIKVTDPLIHKRLVEKFKYFNPAFHSMSPEGFNARLNFLHQCTRQGHTLEPVSGTDDKSNTSYTKSANNLAFGRMPVCVLRIGDFINTKIIITNIGINYDNNGGVQWDLNPEGIGVQPMYAKVTLSIVLLGGQSLNGPINRLQNAITFDYYANAGVYDDRADMIKRDENGEIVYDKIFVAPSQKLENKTSVNQNPNENSDNIDNLKDYSNMLDDMQKEVNKINDKWNNMSTPTLSLGGGNKIDSNNPFKL